MDASYKLLVYVFLASFQSQYVSLVIYRDCTLCTISSRIGLRLSNMANRKHVLTET